MTKIQVISKCLETLGFDQEEAGPIEDAMIPMLGDCKSHMPPSVEAQFYSVFSGKHQKTSAFFVLVGVFIAQVAGDVLVADHIMAKVKNN